VRAFSAGKPLVPRNPGAVHPWQQVRLGWHPRLATDLELDWTAAWYRRHQDGASARDLCLDQIQRYQKQDGR
jgi:hypothetical protein